MPKYKPLYSLYKGLRESKYDVPDSYVSFQKTLTQPGNAGAKSRRELYQSLKESNYDVPDTYEDFYKNLFVPVNSTTSRALKIGENPNTPTVNRYRQKMFDSVDPNKNGLNNLSNRAVGQAVRATNNVRKPVIAKVVNQKGKPTGKEFAITPAKTAEDLDREYAQETTKNWENELHDQMADADKDAAKISDMFKSFIGSTDEVGSVWGNMTRGGGIAGTPHSVTTNNGILENTEARQILAAGDYNRKRRELLQLEQDSRNGAIFDNHSFFRGMYDAAKDTGLLTGGASDLINAGSLLATKQDLDNGVHTEAGDMLMQQAVKNSDAQSQYGDNQGWMYTGGVITTNMAPFMVQIGSAGFSKGMSNAIGKVVQGAASKVALGTMEKATGMVGAHIANYIGKVTGLTTKAFGKAIQYGIVGAAQANTVGLGNVANDVINRYTGQVYQDEQGNYKFGTFDSDGNLVHEGGEDFLTAFVKGDAAQTIEFATELAGGGIDAAGTALKNFVTKGGKKIINKYNMENVSKVIDFLLNNKVSKNARYLKAGADRTLGKVELNSIVGESLEEELGIIANTVFTGDNKISDLWDEKQQSQIWGGMLLSIGLMKGAVAPFHAYNAKQYYSYKHKLDKADVNLSQLLGKEKWEELRNQIDATTNEDMPEMVNRINRDVALGKNRQPVREYIQNLLIMRGYDIGNMLAAKKAVEDKGEGVSVKNMEKNQAYQQGRDAYGYDTHEIQLDQEDKQKSLAQLIGISEQQLASMSDEELEALSGRDDNIDRAIYDYQLSTARYEGVIDNARDQIDLEVQRAAQAVDMYTDKSRNTIRNATIKATGGLEDYGVYIINGNIATHEDGSIDISNSDDMILYYDPTTNTVEHADATMFAELGSEENADEVRSQAMADAKEKAIKETTGIIDGVVEIGTQFKTVGADGTEHTYEVLADNGDGTAMITIDGNVPTELVNGESVNIPVSFEELQKMKDEYDQQRLQAAKAEREQMEKERAAQQTQETEQTQPSFDFNQILNDNGNVVLVDVLDKDGNTKYPDSRLFLIRDAGAKAKVVELKSDGTIVPHAVNKEDVATISSMSLDEYKQAMPKSSMIEDNSGEESDENSQLANLGLPKGSEIWMSGDGFGRPKENTQSKVVGIDEQGSIVLEDKDGKKWSASFDYINNHRELPPLDENTNIVNEENNQVESNAEENTPAPEQTPAMTLEDGTIVPMLEDGNPDFSKLTAAQTAELYDTQFGEDADSIVSGYVSDAKKALDKASNMTVKGKTFVEQKAAKDAKEKAIADAQAAYDSAIAIRDAYNERQLAKVEDTAEGRKELIEKARRKFARLKSAVKDDAEAVSQLYRETIGSLLHRLYDGTGIDVTDTIPLTAEEYVASNLGAHSLNYEGTETSKGVKQETGLSREDFAKTQLLAADGKGTTIDALVHSLWENRPSNLESLDTQDIRNALIGVLNSGFKASEARNFVENIRIAQAENILEEQKRAQENAAYDEQHKAEPEAELKAKSDEKAELKAKSEAKLDNESSNESNDLGNDLDNEKTNDKINAPEVPEDATDENPLGLQLSEDKVPFEIEGGKSGETYDINDNEDRQRLINDNKVDDKDILDIDMPKHVHKAIKELCKKMGLKVQFLYMGARSNGWIENGTMYLALDTEKATQFVFGHEMTHAIKQKNPEAYKELVKVAMAVTTKKKFEEDLAKVYQNYHGISGYNNVDDYVEEVVADNLGKFINDFDLAQKFSLRLNHPILGTILHAIQKIKSLLYGDFYKSVDALERIVEKAYVETAKGQVTNSETGEDVSFSLRQKPEPKKKGIGYKVFVLKDGKLYPPMVANPDGAATPVGVWLDADAAPIAGESKTGRPQVKQGGKGTQGGSGKLAYRPGWHLGVVPYAIQFNRKDAEGNKTLFPKNFVFAEVEYAADVDYQEEARQEGINPSGKYQHSLAGLKHLPTDGYYMYRTNPNPETDPWVITGAMKVNRILTRAEQAELVKNAGREPQQIQEGDIVTDDVVNSINQEIADAPKFSLKVYHGSGADFTEFDFDHMGEGAGSQAFGWGGYVTSSEEIGKSYANLSRDYGSRNMYKGDVPLTKLEKAALSSYIENNKNHEGTIKDGVAGLIERQKALIAKHPNNPLSNSIKKRIEVLEVAMPKLDSISWDDFVPSGKNLYEVDIPEDNGSNYIEFYEDATPEFKEQIKGVLANGLPSELKGMPKYKEAERKFYEENGTDESFEKSLIDDALFELERRKSNGDAYNALSVAVGDKLASKILSSLGYTGIKYPAGTIMGGVEGDEINYVIFKPEDMRITEHTKFSLKSKPVRFEAGKKLSDEEKKEVLSTLKDAYKVNGVPYHIEETAGGKEKRVYEPTADSYVVSDITNRPLRYYITLPDGRVAHPTEVYPNISDNEVKSSATKQGLLDEEVDQIVSAAIGNMKDIADNAKAVEILNELQNLPHETHDVGYGLNHVRSYNYKTGIFTSDAAQAIDYVVRRMRRKEDVPAEIPAALKKAVANSYGMVDNLIDGMSSIKFSLKDNQGNPLNQDGTLKLDKIKSVDELTDEDFLHPTRNVELPSLPKKIADAIGTEGKPVVIKKNIFERNYMRHKDVTPELSKVIFKSALYNPDLYGQNQKKTRPYNWVLISTKDEKGNNRTVLLEVNPNKDNVEIVHWHFIDERGLKKIKKQADREDGQLLILPSDKEEVGALSDPTVNLSAAKIDNSSETAKENGEKFSLKDEKTMFGMHNISLDKLRKAIKQGGFAAPSMGVIDSKNGIYSGYGEITLIPKAEKIAKRTGKNIGTYAADAWTPIYPPVEKKFGGNGGDVAYDDIESVPKEMQPLTRNAINSFMDGREANGLAYLYLQEKGKAPELVHVEGKYPKELHDEVKGILGKLNGIYNTTDEQKEKLLDLFIREVYDGNKEEFDNDIKKFIKKDEEFIKKRPNSNIAKNKQLDVDWMKEHGYDYGALSRFVDGILRDAETSGKVDENATMKAAQQYIQDKGMKEDFDSWKEKLNDRYNVEEVIFAGYKPDGNRKYLPNTVENAVKVMKQDGKNASVGSASFSHFVASILKPMGTLDQIRKKKGNLTGNYEDVEKFQEKWQPVYDELADKMQPDAEPFESYGMDRLEEVATQKNPKKYAKEEYGVDLTDEDINKLNELIEAVKNDKPSIYFETKFMRPYGLDEFEKAIVPNDTPSDVVDALKMAGIDVSSYERGNAEDRQKVTMDAINSSDNIRFSLKEEKEKIVADAKANGTYMTAPNGEKTKLDAEQWATVRTTNFKNWFGDWENDPENASKVVDENGEPMVVWHGRSAEFNTFEKKEGVRFIMGLEDKVKAEGFFFSPDKGLAEEFASNSSRHRGGKANVVPCFLNIRRPMDLTGEDYDRIYEDVTGWEYMVGMDTQDNLWGIMDEEGMADKIKEKGYDGAIFVEEVDDSYEPTKISYCALDANQIKSAENNNGDFSADNNDIRFSLKYMMAKPEGWKQANKKAIHIAEAIERDPKFSLKNLDGTLIKAGTYFSGGGLVEEGLKGIIDPVVAVEYDEKISGVYRNNFGQHIVTADVRDVDPKELVKQIDGEVEYFHASPVCKNYSQAKSNHAEVELDKETAASTAEFINAIKPKVVTIENVKGYKDSDAMKTITDALDANGYTWDADVYNAADYGGYTNRERLIVRAVRDGKLPEKPKKMAHKSGWYEAVADIIPTLTEKKNGVAPWMDIRLKADGIDWRNIDKPLYVMGSAYADGKIPHAFADELLPTLRTKSGDVIVMPDGKVYRALGRVLARVSGVSDDYKMPFSENLSHTIIGNGIPTQLTEHVIAPLLQNILRPTTPEDGNTKFSLRYDQFEHDLNQWKKDNNLPKDAKRPTIPQRNAGESAVDFLRRVDEYRKQMALWKTAPTYEQHLLSDDTALGEFNRELQRGSVLKRIAFQDSMLAIRKAQEAIMKEVGVDRLNMAEDAYTAENRSHGKGKNEFEEYNNEFLQPLRKAYHQMKKVLGDSYDNVRIYMMAKHGLERDAQMAFKKSLEADYEDVAQRSAAYKAYKGDMNRIINDSDLEFGRVDFTTWRQRDNALRVKYSPSYMDYRYDKNGIAYDYSGLSALFDGSDFEEAAHKLISEIESKYVAETKNLWDATNAATKKILRDGYKAGMMSKDTYQYVRDMYSHYIPLRGWDGTTADQVWDYIGGGKGAFNQSLKKAHGRTSIADDPIAYIENMAESGILLNNKNWVKQHLMLLAQNHPTSLLTLSKAWYVKSVDDNGNEEWIPATPQITSQMDSNQVKAAIDAFEKKMEKMAQTGDATQKRDGLNIAYPQTHSEEREHEVRVMKDGEEYVIYVNGDPQLAQAMNNTRAHRVREIQSGKLDRAAAWLGRKMAAAYTSLSPLFIPSNYFRDLTMTLASTAIREDGRYNYLLRKNLATSWNLGFMLRDYQNGKLRDKVNNGNATPKEQMFYDFMMNGGETGFVSSLDVEDLKKKFKNDLKDLDRWKTNPVKVGHTIMDGIEFLNRAIEDSNRFAVYMTSIQYGRSIDEAVNDAKDVTLNFNRKGTGEYGWQMIRNLYLFINPAVQSLQTLGALVKHHPFKFTAVTASWLASGVLVPIVNAALMSMLGGDDDKDKYWQFTKWDRRNNLIVWVPFTHEYVKIPLAQEFRAFYGVGDMIASKMMGGELAEESWSQYAEDLLGQVVDMLPLDPTGYDGNIAVSLMPNAIRPVFELAFNVDFTGKPLFKETEYNKYDPNFTKAYVGTPDWLVRASRMVNSIGNDYPDVQQNSIDAFGDPRYNLNNPAVVDHVLSSYLGGAYTMGSQVLGVLTKSLNDPKEIKVADIPLFSKFVSNPDDRPVTKKQGDEFWNMKENHDRAANTLSKLKKQAKVDGDYSMLERFYGSEEYKQYKQDDVKVKKYEEDKKKERAEESGEEYRPHKLNAEDIYKAHATPKDDFEDLKLKQLYAKLNGFKTSYDLLVDTAPSQSDGYYNTNKAAIDAIDEISLDKQEISELKKGFLDDGKDAYNAEDMKQIRDLRKKILAVLEKANKVVVANQKAKGEK